MALRRALLVAALAASCLAQQKVSNMNGAYVIGNPNPNNGHVFSTDYSTKNAEYFDVYSPPITTVYAQVYWTMMDSVPLPDDIVQRFKGKVIAIVGYEVDQVNQTAEGEQSIPIYKAYNHHYEAYLLSANSELVEVPASQMNSMSGLNHGADTMWMVKPDPNPIYADIPTAQYFSEGNGGEFRKSYHGYPNGYAQLLQSPTTFRIQPMQIDTHNRDYDGPGFKAGLLPRESQAPPGAPYSGLLECPCTDRIVKEWSTVYSTLSSGTCPTPVTNATECFEAAMTVGKKPAENQTVSDDAMPSGCYVVNHDNGTVTAVFNTLSNPTSCGGAERFGGLTNALITVKLLLDGTVPGGEATITLEGPDGVWFGLGFNATEMADLPYTIIVDGTGNVTERKLGDHDPGNQIPTQVKVVSNTVFNGTRTVVLTRAFKGSTPDHFTFSTTDLNIPFINAIGSTPALAYHKARGTGKLILTALDAATCVCNAGVHGTINGLAFSKNCVPEPMGDLLAQKNPTCFIQTYVGGQSCCHHQTILLDKDQPVDNRTDTYHLKFRFWFQEYTAEPTPSHQELTRFYFQTEAWSSEYDVLQCPAGTPTQECVQMITAHFKVSDMVQVCDETNITNVGDCGTGNGIKLIYAGGHCHAPSCISMELYNADTGDLLCQQLPIWGNSTEVMNEEGYLAIPPCLWGPAEEGLTPPTFLSWDTNLTSIKRNNNTYGHYGEMASWQMRGIFADS